MNRRQLLKLLALGVVGQNIDPLLWVRPKNRIFVPHPAQVAFLNSKEPMTMFGVPYHVSNAVSRQWLGIMRTDEWRPHFVETKKE